MKNFRGKLLPAFSLAALAMGISSDALAHTGVKDTGTEGTTLYTAFTLSHGCASNSIAEGSASDLGVDGNSAQLPVIGQTVLFPNASDAVFGKIDAAGYLDTSIGSLGTYISGVTNGVLPIAPTATFPQPFPKTYIVRAAKNDTRATGGSTRGFQSWGDAIPMGGGTVALSGFKVSGINFVATECAKSLKVQIAIANFCRASGGGKKDPDSNRADIWIGNMTSKFNDPLLMPNAPGTKATSGDTNRDKIYWPTLTINRNLTTNPLPQKCNGTGIDVGIRPSDEDIDANLPFAKPRKGYGDLPGNKFWPGKQ